MLINVCSESERVLNLGVEVDAVDRFVVSLRSEVA